VIFGVVTTTPVYTVVETIGEICACIITSARTSMLSLCYSESSVISSDISSIFTIAVVDDTMFLFHLANFQSIARNLLASIITMKVRGCAGVLVVFDMVLDKNPCGKHNSNATSQYRERGNLSSTL